MSVPETLSEFGLSVNVVFANGVGDSICHTWGPKGGGDLKTGTTGISVHDCSSSSPVEMWGFFSGMVVTFIVLGEVLPIPGINFFEDIPFANPGCCQFRASKFLTSSSRTQDFTLHYQLLGPNAVSHSHTVNLGLY